MNNEKQNSSMDREFEKWWNEYFKQYQYGTEESEAAKSWAKTGWWPFRNIVEDGS